MITVESHSGRLIEVRFSGEVTPEEMKWMRTPLSENVTRINVPVIFAVDFRTCDALSPDVSPMMLGLMRSDNARTLRSAHLFRDGAPLVEQMRAGIASARNPDRHAFFDVDELAKWLAEVATAEELGRVRAFFRG